MQNEKTQSINLSSSQDSKVFLSKGLLKRGTETCFAFFLREFKASKKLIFLFLSKFLPKVIEVIQLRVLIDRLFNI